MISIPKSKSSSSAAQATKRRRAEAELRDIPVRQDHPPTTPGLYLKAEARLRERQKRPGAKAVPVRSTLDNERLVHELQVHQVELEMQNSELLQARNGMEVLLEKYTDLYDFAPVGYLSLDEQGLIQDANLTGAALLGVGRAKLLNRRLPLFAAPASRPVLLAFLEKIFTTAGKQLCEATILRDDGSSFWASLHGTAARSATGEKKWCRVVISDVTAIRRAEEILRQNDALFHTLVEQSPVGVYVVDAGLQLQQVNAKAQPVFKNIRPLIGRDLSEILHILWPNKVAQEIMEHFRRTLRTGEPYFAANFSERRHDLGVTEFYEWQLQRITLPAGRNGVVCFFSNITERKKMEATQRRFDMLAASNRKLEREVVRRQKAEKILKHSEQHQRELLVQSLHMEQQLRQLSRQVLLAQEEERKRVSRELHDVIAQTLTGINIRLATLKTEAGLNAAGFGRSIARTQQIVQKSVDIVHKFARELRPAILDDLGLIPALHSYVKSFARQTGVHAHLTASANVEQLDMPRRTVLFRVAQEALTNITRHAKASRVQVTIQKLADGICMQIKDDGKSFDVNRNLHGQGSKRLGLLGMRERLEMVGGKFTVESSVGKGTTVVAQIPFGRARGGGR